MATLPPSSDFTGASVTEGGFKAALTTLRSYLNDLFGDDSSNKALARETLQVPMSGSVSKTGTYTAVAADCGQTITCSGTWTLTLTSAVTLGDGWTCSVANTGSGVITIATSLSQTIDGEASLVLLAGQTRAVICTGGQFVTVGGGVGIVADRNAQTTAYTVVDSDNAKLIDCSGTWTLSLTAAATLGERFACIVYNSGSGVITIDPAGSEQIDGATTRELRAGETCMLFCNGTKFTTVLTRRKPPTVQTFTANGTWTRPDGCTAIHVTAWGGGGGGVTGANAGSAGRKTAEDIVSPAASYAVVIGAGGTAGNNGGNTTFGGSSLVYAEGGVAGASTRGGTGEGGRRAGSATAGAANSAAGGGVTGGNGYAGGSGFVTVLEFY